MRKLALVLAAALIAAVAAGLPPARAQLDPGFRSFDILQNGVKVGEIFRDPTVDPPEPDRYLEHWVLFDRYVYPGERADVATEIRVGRAEYKNEKDFFARVPWRKGYRYVKVDCLDGTTLPGR